MDFIEWKKTLAEGGMKFKRIEYLDTVTTVLYIKKLVTGEIDFNRLFEVAYEHKGRLSVVQVHEKTYELDVEIPVGKMLIEKRTKGKDREGFVIEDEVKDSFVTDYYELGKAQNAERKLVEVLKELNLINWGIKKG